MICTYPGVRLVACCSLRRLRASATCAPHSSLVPPCSQSVWSAIPASDGKGVLALCGMLQIEEPWDDGAPLLKRFEECNTGRITREDFNLRGGLRVA